MISIQKPLKILRKQLFHATFNIYLLPTGRSVADRPSAAAVARRIKMTLNFFFDIWFRAALFSINVNWSLYITIASYGRCCFLASTLQRSGNCSQTKLTLVFSVFCVFCASILLLCTDSPSSCPTFVSSVWASLPEIKRWNGMEWNKGPFTHAVRVAALRW